MSQELAKFTGDAVAPLTEAEKMSFKEMAKTAIPPRMKLLVGGTEGIDVADEVVKEVNGVILYFQPANVMLEKREDGSMIPVCWSWDAVTSEPTEKRQSKHCVGCKMNEFGSSEKGEGRGKGCKNTMRMFILLESQRLPIMFSVPPTSIRQFKTLIGKLLYRGIPYERAIVNISTKKEMKGGFPVTVAQFKIVGKVEGDAEGRVPLIDELKKEVVPLLTSQMEGKVLADEYTEDIHDSESATTVKDCDKEVALDPITDDIPY